MHAKQFIAGLGVAGVMTVGALAGAGSAQAWPGLGFGSPSPSPSKPSTSTPITPPTYGPVGFGQLIPNPKTPSGNGSYFGGTTGGKNNLGQGFIGICLSSSCNPSSP